MYVGYLGPLEVHGEGGVIEIPGLRLRRLLLRLAVDVGRFVSARELEETVWEGDPPSDPNNALQSLVSRLRRTLGDSRLVEQSAGGYRLALPAVQVDAAHFAAGVDRGSRLLADRSYAEAVEVLDEALALWRGEPLAEDPSPSAEVERARLNDLRLRARRNRAGADLHLGQVDDVILELETLHAQYPLREDLVLALMDAFVAADRPAEALAAYERTRELLADTLGSDPSPALAARHLDVLRLHETHPTALRPGTNLRAALTSFVGRDLDVLAVRERLAQSRLVTLLGAGGSGKTRLASEVAAQFAGSDRAPDGVWFVDLAPVTDPDNLPLAILDGLGVRDVAFLEQRGDRPARSTRQRVFDSLVGAGCVVVLDNCEHLVEAAAALVADVLATCPAVTILATSREPLAVDGEMLYPLAPLSVPEPDATPDQALASPAVQLFLDRAHAAGATLDSNPTTLPAIAEVVRRLDGLPLAIELAAARLRAMSVDEVAARLSDRFRLLTGGRRTSMPRHRTLRAVVEWSWDLLSPTEREVAEHFSVLGSGGTAESIAAICPGWREGDAVEVTDLLHALVDKSLLVLERGAGGTRYRMLETLREYGGERLAQQHRLEAARAAHAHYFADLAGRADQGLRGPEQVHWLAVLDDERDNVLSALGYLCDDGDAERAVDLVVRLSWYWMLRANGQDSVRWLRSAMAVPGAESVPLFPLAEALDFMTSATMSGEGPAPPRPRRPLDEIAAGLVGHDAEHQIVAVLRPLLLVFSGDNHTAETLLADGLRNPDPWVRAATRSVRLALAENAGDLDTIRGDIDAGITEWQALGDHWGVASMFAARGQVRLLDGDLDGAAGDLEAALVHLNLLGGGGDDLLVRLRLADLRLRSGDLAAAREIVDVVRSDARYRDLGPSRDLLADMMSAQVCMTAGDEPELRTVYDRLVETLTRLGQPSPFDAHASAVARATLGAIATWWRDLDAAAGHLTEGHRLALITHDLPILAVVGTATAGLAHARHQDQAAARILGASARLRGSDDSTQVAIAALAGSLRRSLGPAYDEAYLSGRQLDKDAALEAIDPAALLAGTPDHARLR